MRKHQSCGYMMAIMALCLLLGGCSAGEAPLACLLPDCTPMPGQAYTALAGEAPEGMSLVSETERLALYVNETTAELAVRDRATGFLYTSNPEGAKNDPIATKTEKGALRSQIIVAYYNASQNEALFYSAQDAVDKGQFTLESIEGGVRITYTVGETQPITDLMPRYILPERMQTLVYDNLDAEAASYIAKRYIVTPGHEDFLELPPATRRSTTVAKKLAQYFMDAGYTWDDLEEDNRLSGYEQQDTSIHITVPVEFRVEEDHFSARVIASEIELQGDIQLSGVDLLPFFGAGSTSDEGYTFLPAGSGALLRFNHGKQREAVYQQAIYGADPTLLSDGRTQTSESIRLPVFGIRRGETAFLAVVSQGEAEGFITADVSGRKNSYNYAYARFRLRAFETLSMSGSSGAVTSMNVFQKQIYQGPMQVDYYFLEAGAGYSEMAARYRRVLEAQGALKGSVTGEKIPLYLSVVNAVEKMKRILGIPYEGMVEMTTWEQAAQMAQALNEKWNLSVRMRLMGWFNGGVDHDVAKDVDLNGLLGSREAFAHLAALLEEQGGCLYPDVAFQYVYQTTDHFCASREAARTISGSVRNAALYLLAGIPSDMQNRGARFYITAPSVLLSHVEGFLQDWKKLSLDGLSLRDLGSVLASDAYMTRSVSRTAAQQVVIHALETLRQRAQRLLLADANAYALFAADDLVNIPEDGAHFYILDESVPFYAMVIHGRLDYAGTPLNVRDDYDRQAALLSMLENGCAPHFLLTWEETYRLNGSVYERWYATAFDTWREDVAYFTQVYEKVLLPLRRETMTCHELLDNGLRVVTYSDGTRICVNPSAAPAAYAGHTIAPMDYLVLKGGEQP